MDSRVFVLTIEDHRLGSANTLGPNTVQAGKRVAVYDEEELTRRGLGQMLTEMPAVQDVCLFASLDALAQELRRESIDVLIVMGRSHAFDEAVLLGERAKVRTLALVHDPDVADGQLASARLSVRGLTKEALAEAIEQIGVRREPFAESVRRVRVDNPLTKSSPHRAQLSSREMMILALMAEGHGNKRIARTLGLSEHGVKRAITVLLARLDCPNRTHAVARALREGLLTPSARAQLEAVRD